MLPSRIPAGWGLRLGAEDNLNVFPPSPPFLQTEKLSQTAWPLDPPAATSCAHFHVPFLISFRTEQAFVPRFTTLYPHR